jgi:mono/diheme cytochrome c family protein
MAETLLTLPVQAVIGLFDGPDPLLAAVPALRARNLGRLEAYTPYPVHGLAEALGGRPSPLGGMVLVMGILGALAALGFQYWVSAVDYPIVTGGKPPGSWEAFVPVMFEVTVLFATFTAGLGMLGLLNGLPFFGHPLHGTRAVRAVTRDRFALAVFGAPVLDAATAAAAREALAAAGARDLETMPAPATGPAFTSAGVLRALGGVALACLGAGAATRAAVKFLPELRPWSNMERQPRLGAQQPCAFFPDGSGMRPPAAGAVSRGSLHPDAPTQEAAAALANPLPRTPEVFELGRRAFRDRCAVCHGALGDGRGSLGPAYGGKPANLQSQTFLDYPDGKIYWTILHGKGAMPPQEADLDEPARWAVVHYLRALQRARNATDADLAGGAGGGAP